MQELIDSRTSLSSQNDPTAEPSAIDGCLNGKLARFRAFEDAIGIRRRTAKIIVPVNSVGQ